MLVSLVLSAQTREEQNGLQSGPTTLRIPRVALFGTTGPASVCITIEAS
ncbi:uncharacterized protein PgNI_09561, partial [Pyricularia grisea]|uniref:Uncharacterized protein n=1 Tax=Pyricularia grisea TaxID=148305 RepID=A0A6P8ATQ1_PYRGI